MKHPASNIKIQHPPTPKPEDVIWFFTKEIRGLEEADLSCTVREPEVVLRATHWLGDEKWAEIMDWVDAMNGEWVKDGKNSRWVIEIDWIGDRVAYAKFWDQYHAVAEWWIAMPRSAKELMKTAYPMLLDKVRTMEEKVTFLASTREWANYLSAQGKVPEKQPSNR